MGARIFIETKDIIQPTERMVRHGIVQTVGNPRLYLFHDEYHEEQFGRFLPTVIRECFRSPVEYTKNIIEDLASWPDERIAHHLDVMWVRPTFFWNAYKVLVLDYLLAKRDYLKAMVDAEILGIYTLEKGVE